MYSNANLVSVRSTSSPLIKGATLSTKKPERPQMFDFSIEHSGDTDELVDAKGNVGKTGD